MNYEPKTAACFEDEILINNICQVVGEISTQAELFDKYYLIDLFLTNTLQLLLAVLFSWAVFFVVIRIFGGRGKNKRFKKISKNWTFKKFIK